MGNRNLRRAKKAKNDEFYTQLEDIEKELMHYKDQFRGKVVFCNCDDPEYSNFWLYFKLNFKHLGLKKLISTHYDPEEPTYKLEYDGQEIVKTKLKQNGDFRSPEAIEILKQSDIICTNPPFSLFRKYLTQLIKYKKDFLIMGNNNAITYKEIFPLLKKNKMWLGHNSNKTLEFRLSDDYEKWDRIDEEGNKYGKVPAISWFTSLDVAKRHEEIILYREYRGNEEKYPKYDNYDAIEVSRVANIPYDYDGIMGVPITFMTKYNPEQFEILGMTKTPICYDNDFEAKRIKRYKNATQHSKNGKKSSGNKVNDGSTILLDEIPKNKVYYTTDDVEGYLVAQYPRLLIRNKLIKTNKEVDNENYAKASNY